MPETDKERIAQIRHFFLSGASICPFARSYADRIGIASLRDDYTQTDLIYPVTDLVKGRGLMAATYVFESSRNSHREERNRAVRLFKDLNRLLLVEEYGQKVLEEMPEIEHGLDAAFSPASSINPLLSYNEKPLFSIAMNPIYSNDHPRWAPSPIVVVTRHEDVAAAPEAARDAIREDMLKRTGSVYDADQLYLML